MVSERSGRGTGKARSPHIATARTRINLACSDEPQLRLDVFLAQPDSAQGLLCSPKSYLLMSTPIPPIHLSPLIRFEFTPQSFPLSPEWRHSRRSLQALRWLPAWCKSPMPVLSSGGEFLSQHAHQLLHSFTPDAFLIWEAPVLWNTDQRLILIL